MTSPHNLVNTPLQQQIVQITSVDPVGGTATAITRQKSSVSINITYHVGAVHYIPCVNEQWVVKKVGVSWALDRKLPKYDNSLANVVANPVEGLTQIGSSGTGSGPLVLQGSVIQPLAPLQLPSYPTASRPDPGVAGAGSLIYDSTLGKIAFSDGTDWTVMT